MKALFLLFLCIPFLMTAQAPSKDIVGKWQGSSGLLEAVFIFKADGYAFMGDGKKLVGGKEHYIQGKRVTVTYTINTSKKPMHLDLVIANDKDAQKMIVPMIFEFVDKNNLKILGGDQQIRPTAFNSDAIIFKRVED